MSAKTLADLDDAIRAHVSDEVEGGVAVAWTIAVGTAGDPDSDFYWTGPDDQPGYVSAGLATFLQSITSLVEDAES